MSPSNEAPGSIERLGATVRRSAMRMSRMIDDLIEFTRTQLGGGIKIDLEPGDLGELASEAIDEMRIAHPDRAFIFESKGDHEGNWDPDRVMQAISNLLSNAVQHGRGDITISVTESADHHSLTLTVHNWGPPVAADQLTHLFDPLKLETAKTRHGLGLGLFIVRQIALGHGARCEVESTERAGTTFRVIWPRTPASEVPDR